MRRASAASDYQPSEDDNVLVQGVAGDEDGLGYFGFSYYEQNKDKLNLVAVDGGERLRRRRARRRSRTAAYTPLSRPLFMYPSAEVARASRRSTAFMEFVVDNYEDDRRAGADRPDDREQAAKAKAELDEARSASGSEPGRRSGSRHQQRGKRGAGGQPALGVARRRWGEEVIKARLFLAALISVLTTLGIVISLLGETIEFFQDVGDRRRSSPTATGRRCSPTRSSASGR